MKFVLQEIAASVLLLALLAVIFTIGELLK